MFLIVNIKIVSYRVVVVSSMLRHLEEFIRLLASQYNFAIDGVFSVFKTAF
jgi:hypothetical protein